MHWHADIGLQQKLWHEIKWHSTKFKMAACWRFAHPECFIVIIIIIIISSFQEWANTMARRPSSVRLSVCLSVCKLLRKSLLLADKWPDRNQTFTRWTPGQRASRVCSRSKSRSKVTWYAHFLGFLEWATPSLTVWLLLLFLLGDRSDAQYIRFRPSSSCTRN